MDLGKIKWTRQMLEIISYLWKNVFILTIEDFSAAKLTSEIFLHL